MAPLRAGAQDSTPILPVTDLDRSVAFYESAGLDARVYEGGGFAFVEYEDESVFDLDVCEHLTPDTNGAGCFLIVRGVEEWHGVLEGRGPAGQRLGGSALGHARVHPHRP